MEGYYCQVRKVTKTKGAFTSDMALLKLVYPATMNIQKKWTSPLNNWSLAIQQLYIRLEDRVSLDNNSNHLERGAGAKPHSKIDKIQDLTNFEMKKI